MSKEIEKKVREVLATNVDSKIDFKEVPVDQDLSEIGFNSIDFIKVVLGLEMSFDFEWDDDGLEFEAFNTIRKLTEFIEDKIH